MAVMGICHDIVNRGTVNIQIKINIEISVKRPGGSSKEVGARIGGSEIPCGAAVSVALVGDHVVKDERCA